MASYTHYNIRFKKKGEGKIGLKDYEHIKNLLFFNEGYKEYSKRISNSWTGMFIFELCEFSNSIVFETTPIRAIYLTEILDYIRDNEDYTIWTIWTHEDRPDYLEIYDGRLTENYCKLCIYYYDEVTIQFKDLNHWTKVYFDNLFSRIGEKEYQHSALGQYYSHNEIQDDINKERKSSFEKKCLIAERESYILSNCYKQEPVSYNNSENNWYSDPLISYFMSDF
ncbi:MAG: hypothetical protein P1U56_17590 [Saprospiraceae bacterium]|nr:hypothetical protein [Saprospiraceae bacterium]